MESVEKLGLSTLGEQVATWDKLMRYGASCLEWSNKGFGSGQSFRKIARTFIIAYAIIEK